MDFLFVLVYMHKGYTRPHKNFLHNHDNKTRDKLLASVNQKSQSASLCAHIPSSPLNVEDVWAPEGCEKGYVIGSFL